MSSVVEEDEKGRILIPIEIRRKLRSKRFKVSVKGEGLELVPLAGAEQLKGKYRNLIESEWDELEEKGEEFVAASKR